MARPAAKELTERELQVMHVFWQHGECGVAEVREYLALLGLNLSYATVANLVRIVLEKGFVEPTTGERPFRYRPSRSYEEVSGRLLGDILDRVFGGSREQLLLRLLERQRLTSEERAVLEEVLREEAA